MKITGFLFLAFVIGASMLAAPSHAVNPDEVLSNPTQELRAREISKELRCLVCQNQSIDDSDADLARDLRVLVRDRITQGDTDQEVIEFVVRRYGDFVLLRPPVKGATLVLWGGPVAIALFGVFATILFLRRNRRRVDLNALAEHHSQQPMDQAKDITDGLSPSEKARLERILGGGQR